MTERSVPEWQGAGPDTPVPDRVRVRVFEHKGGRCHKCTRKIAAGESWTCEHLIALINGGKNRESNLDITCDWCLPQKNAADATIKAKSYRIKKLHLGVKKKGPAIPGSRRSPWKRRMDGTTVRR